jgi:large subunit ribosomal protein L29
MTNKEIRELSDEEIVTKLRECRGDLLHLRLRKQTGQVEKTHELRELRKQIARLETILKQREAAPAPASAKALAGKPA